MLTDLELMKRKAEGYLQDYLNALKHIDELTEENRLWEEEAKRWREMYIEYDEMLESQVQSAVDKLEGVWKDLDELKKRAEDML
jgi:FtsZ-binding cell division protein ZapB